MFNICKKFEDQILNQVIIMEKGSCNVCTNEKLLQRLKTCDHGICTDCINYLCSDSCPVTIRNKCPICHTLFNKDNIATHHYNYNVNNCNTTSKTREIETALARIYQHDPSFRHIFHHLNTRIGKEDTSHQILILDEFFEGKIDYAQMRMHCG